ncbi:hypothetical protein M3P05_20295 [Sansalvadorimonas sp. 2012CJ34-2]|uniref:Uncharacterized protein n=1 Tax=Parendozoicomonas callyspongiae TaxID=2942213 RepID=A0ABT0PLL0_9GAMM|nr:hypothetical protein [Sansalvadorimonas sp. 2012CJ34-2]MCL6272264.1 hypothetical protein [Sansalvadorimonas sp. 2012CJ34-2]
MILHENVTFQFVTNDLSNFDENNENLLVILLIDFFYECDDLEDFFSSFFEQGSGSQTQNEFFTLIDQEKSSFVITESYDLDSETSYNTVSQMNLLPTNQEEDQGLLSCSYGCGSIFTSSQQKKIIIDIIIKINAIG